VSFRTSLQNSKIQYLQHESAAEPDPESYNSSSQYQQLLLSDHIIHFCVSSFYVSSSKIEDVRKYRTSFYRHLGTILINQNSIAEEIKSRLRSGNACYHSVQNLLSSRLLSRNLKIQIYRTIILSVFVWV